MTSGGQGGREEDAVGATSAEEVTARFGAEPREREGYLEISAPSVLVEPCEGRPNSVRFQVERAIGKGGSGFVYSVTDHDLGRQVAVKHHRAEGAGLEQARLAHEAKITASLEHPNIVPVYDVGDADDGSTYIVMRLIRGRSLRELLEEARVRGRKQIMPINDLVNVFLKVCDAVAYAHSRGVVHRDLKPHNIMIGDFGEVTLIDWGAGASSSTGPSTETVGTPVYMSPEQARGEPAGVQSDVYSSGATLFHCLLLRYPGWDDDPVLAWQKKLAGVIDPITAEERARVPTQLMAIVFKALHADPAERYASMRELSADLRRFQEGAGVWGAPVFQGPFTAELLAERFMQPLPGAFMLDRKRLISARAGRCVLLYKKPLAGGVAIEFDGEFLPGTFGSDLSVIWTESGLLTSNDAGRVFTLQVGAFTNTCAGIWQSFIARKAVVPLALEAGRTYRIRAEIGGHMLALFVDGVKLCEHRELVPFTSGYVGLYGWNEGQAFSNLRIVAQGLPDRVSATAIGDCFFQKREYEEASNQYGRILETGYEGLLGQEALYKRGLCELRSGRPGEAQALWSRLLDPTYRGYAQLNQIDRWFEAGDDERVCSALVSFDATLPELQRFQLTRWLSYIYTLADEDFDRLEPYLAVRERLFQDDPLTNQACAVALHALSRWQEVLERFPEERMVCSFALHALGRFAEVIERYPEFTWQRWVVLRSQGLFAQVLRENPQNEDVLLRSGRVDQVLARAPTSAVALLFAGRIQEALHYADAAERRIALRFSGRTCELVQAGEPDDLVYIEAGPLELAERAGPPSSSRYNATVCMTLFAFARGEQSEYERLRLLQSTLPWSYDWQDIWFHEFFLLPFLDELSGNAGACRRSLTEVVAKLQFFFQQNAWYCARLILGEIDDSGFDEQPQKFGLQARRMIAHALSSELQNDRERARAAYGSYLSIARHERALDWVAGSPIADHFARLRLRALG